MSASSFQRGTRDAGGGVAGFQMTGQQYQLPHSSLPGRCPACWTPIHPSVRMGVSSSAFQSSMLNFPILAHGLWLPRLASFAVCEDRVPRALCCGDCGLLRHFSQLLNLNLFDTEISLPLPGIFLLKHFKGLFN